MSANPLAVSATKLSLGSPSKVVRGPRIRGASVADLQSVPVIILLYGPPGSGKTNAVADLILQGKKILLLDTDAGGGNAITTIKSRIFATDKNEDYLQEHLRWVYIPLGDGRDPVSEFLQLLKNPTYELWESFDPDFLVWEGFSTYQSNYIKDDFDDADGTLDNFKLWNNVASHTIRDCSHLFMANNPKTGKTIHKILTCLEGLKTDKIKTGVKPNGEILYDLKTLNSGFPALQTKVTRLFAASFDISLRLSIDNGKYLYYTETKSGEQDAKKRIKLPAAMEANFVEVWNQVVRQLHLDN